MTELLSPPLAPAPAPPSASPRARRWPKSRWNRLLGGRVVLGIGLMLVAVVIGARVVGGATSQAQWLAAAHALPAGHVITAADLAPVAAHLPAAAAKQYFTSSADRLVGRTLTRPLASGELLPAAAVATTAPAASRVLPVLVKAGRLPSLRAGDRVDVYVLATPRGAAASEIRVLHDVEYVAADVLSSGDTSIQLRVAPADVIAAVAASQSEKVDVVRIDPDATGSAGESGPGTAPAYGG